MKKNGALILKGASPLLQSDLTKGGPGHISFTFFPVNMTESNGKTHQIVTIVQGLLYVFSSSWNIHKTFLTIVYIHYPSVFPLYKNVKLC